MTFGEELPPFDDVFANFAVTVFLSRNGAGRGLGNLPFVGCFVSRSGEYFLLRNCSAKPTYHLAIPVVYAGCGRNMLHVFVFTFLGAIATRKRSERDRHNKKRNRRYEKISSFYTPFFYFKNIITCFRVFVNVQNKNVRYECV